MGFDRLFVLIQTVGVFFLSASTVAFHSATEHSLPSVMSMQEVKHLTGARARPETTSTIKAVKN